MTQIASDSFLIAWEALPAGHFEAIYCGRRWGVTRTEKFDGRQAWLWAEELGGKGRISCNLYRLKSGARLKPCEMPAQEVMDFVFRVEPLWP